MSCNRAQRRKKYIRLEEKSSENGHTCCGLEPGSPEIPARFHIPLPETCAPVMFLKVNIIIFQITSSLDAYIKVRVQIFKSDTGYPGSFSVIQSDILYMKNEMHVTLAEHESVHSPNLRSPDVPQSRHNHFSDHKFRRSTGRGRRRQPLTCTPCSTARIWSTHRKRSSCKTKSPTGCVSIFSGDTRETMILATKCEVKMRVGGGVKIGGLLSCHHVFIAQHHEHQAAWETTTTKRKCYLQCLRTTAQKGVFTGLCRSLLQTNKQKTKTKGSTRDTRTLGLGISECVRLHFYRYIPAKKSV